MFCPPFWRYVNWWETIDFSRVLISFLVFSLNTGWTSNYCQQIGQGILGHRRKCRVLQTLGWSRFRRNRSPRDYSSGNWNMTSSAGNISLSRHSLTLYHWFQSISGTGALRIGGAFFNAWWEGNKEVYLPNPSWGNHTPIFKHSGLKVGTYSYYDPKTCGFNFQGALDDISVSHFAFNSCEMWLKATNFLFF